MMLMWANNLIISYSWWSIVLVLITGLFFAGILYIYNKKNKLSKGLTAMLFTVRFIAISLIAFLLLSPFIKTRIRSIEKPVIIVGLDNSASIISSNDSIQYKTSFKESFEANLELLKKEYDVKSYLFGQQVTTGNVPQYTDGRSNYGDFIGFVNSAWSDANTGMLLLVGDGSYNTGFDPVFAAEKLTFPIVSIAMGDTLEQVDASILEVRMNPTAFLDDVVPIEITYSASKLKNKSIQLSVVGFGKTLYSENIFIKTNKQVSSITVPITTNRTGKQRIEISIQPIVNETNINNNQQNKYLDVIESKQKILLLAFVPHPDISAISQSLKTNKNYEITTTYINDFTGNITDYDLVILHQLPAVKNPAARFLKSLEESKTPTLFVLGNQSNLESFNRQFSGVNISSASNRKEQATALINPLFKLFTLSGIDQELLVELPPLTVPLGSYQVNPNASVFSYQDVQGFRSDFPMIIFYQDAEQKTGAILGEGIWRWRMHNFVQENNYLTFDTFIRKSIQYLINRNDQRPFQVFAQDEYVIFDPIVLKAECFNESHELVNTSEIPLTLLNEAGEQFQYLFSPKKDSYALDLGTLPEGIYRYTSTAECQGKNMTESGEFVVTGSTLENRDLKANHRLLYQLAEMNGGRVLYPDNLNSLKKTVDDLGLKSRIDYEIKLIDLGTLPYILIAIFLLLSLEWFLRKYFGTY